MTRFKMQKTFFISGHLIYVTFKCHSKYFNDKMDDVILQLTINGFCLSITRFLFGE